MKKLILIFLLFAFANAALNTFTNAVDHDWSTAGNWSGGAPALGDSCVVNATMCSLSVDNAQVRALNIIGGSFKQSKRPFTVDSTFNWGSSGTLTLDTTLTVTHNLTITNVGTISTNNSYWVHNGTGTILIQRQTQIKTLSCAFPGKTTTHTDNSVPFIISGSVMPLLALNGGTFTDNNSWAFNIKPTASGQPISCGTSTLNGAGLFYLVPSANNIKLSLSKLKATQSGVFFQYQNFDNDTIELIDSMVLTTANIYSYVNSGSSLNSIFRTNNNYMSVSGAFNFGTNGANNGSLNFHFGSSVVSVGSWLKLNNSSSYWDTVYLESSQIQSKGNWDWGTSTKTYVNPGTSRVTFTTGNATITSANKPFNIVIDSVPSANKVTLADSLTCADTLYFKFGKFFSTGFNLNIGHKYRTSNDTVNLSTSRVTMTNANALFYRRSTLSVGQNRGISLVAKGNIKFDLDSSLQFYNILIPDNKKMTLTAGKVLSDSTISSGDLSPDSILSGTPGTRAGFKIVSGTYAFSGANYLKDIASVNLLYDTIAGSVNGGNDSNVIFKDGINQYYWTPTTITVTSCVPSSGIASGGYVDTVKGTGFWSPCSVSVAGGAYRTCTVVDSTKLWLTMPAGTAGAKNVAVKNCDGVIGTGSNVFTYTGTAIIAQRGPLDSYRGSRLAYRGGFRSAWR